MKLSNKITLNLTDAEKEILKITRARGGGLSANEVFRHLLVYQGLCGGSFPVTSRILSLPPEKLKEVEDKILERLRVNEALKPQSFKSWLQESLGKIDPEAERKAGDAFLKDLLGD